MILFEKDWDNYPGAIVDTKCSNVSFLRYAALLKDMGVKNYHFPLVLFNKELQGKDPYDPNLTIEEMATFAIEFKQNPWAYFRMVSRAPGGTFDDPIPFRANRGNIALFWLFFNHITTILIQIRQTGKSFSTDTLMNYLMNIRCVNTQINLLTKDDTLRSANLERLKNIELELPFYLKQRTRNDLGNTEELTIKSLGNSYRGHLPNKSPKMALNVGRGLTSPIFHIDEAAFFYNIAISLPAALAAGTAARDMAKRKGDPYGIIITTTAGKQDDRDGKFMHNMVLNSAIMTEKFYDAKDEEELHWMIRKNSPKGELRVNCTYSHRQLGYTDAWLKEAIETTGAVGEDADRDFFNVWTSGSQLSPIPVAAAAAIRESQVEAVYTEITAPYGYITRWYIPEHEIQSRMNSSSYILGADTSDAAGGDDIALVLRDIKTGEVIATGNYNETNLITFSEFLCNWLVRFSTVTLIVERRSTGAMILDYLLMMLPSKNIDPFTRLYNKAVQEADEYPDRFKEINKPVYTRSNETYTKYKRLFGFATSSTGATSRSELYSTTLLNSAKLTGDKVKDSKLIDQILGLVIRNGRVDHAEGSHDDLCISWLLSFWLLSQGKNLNYYGINSRDIMISNKKVQEDNSPLALYKAREDKILRQKIETLVEDIKNEKDPYVIQLLETKLMNLASLLNQEDQQTLSVDDLIKNLRESRRANTRNYTRYY
jgi:hypothetical protein